MKPYRLILTEGGTGLKSFIDFDTKKALLAAAAQVKVANVRGSGYEARDQRANDETQGAMGNGLIDSWDRPTLEDEISHIRGHRDHSLLHTMDANLTVLTRWLDQTAHLLASDKYLGYQLETDTIFQAAGKRDVTKAAIQMFSEGRSLAEVQAQAELKALNGARYPSASSSSASNLAKVYVTKAWAELAEDCRWWKEPTE